MVSVGERLALRPGTDPGSRQPSAADRPGSAVADASRPGLRRLGLAVVLLVAVVARFWGLQYGLPHSYYPDESSFVGDALHMATTGDLRPSQFLWPTFWIYVVALSLRIGLVLAWIPGGALPLGTPALDNMTYVYGVARTVTALSGVLTVAGVYAIGARWLPRLGVPQPRLFALLAAGFMALSPLHIQHSHVTSADVPTTAFVVLAAYLVLRLLESGATRWYVLGGVALGLASAAKYPSALFAVALVVAHLSRAAWSPRRPWRPVGALVDWRLWLAGLLTIVVFFATSPYILIDWSHFYADFVSQANRVLQRGPVGEVGITGPLAPVLYVPLAMAWGLDAPVAVLALAGLLAGVWLAVRGPAAGARSNGTAAAAPAAEARWSLLAMLAFPLLFYVFSWSWQHRFARYLVPLVPFGCLLAALGLASLASLAARWRPTISGGLLAIVVGAASMLWQADGVIRYDVLLTRTDTRTQTARWLEQNLPPGEQVMVEWYGPPYGNVKQMGFDLSDRPLDRYLGKTPHFVVTSSFSYDRWLRDPAQFGRRADFYTTLHEKTPLLYEIRPLPEMAYDPIQEGWDGWHGIPLDASARPGPILRVHQLTP
jgi:4-amino-4-deoxy-L-arabinose transferase-like glycosyltransferase